MAQNTKKPTNNGKQLPSKTKTSDNKNLKVTGIVLALIIVVGGGVFLIGRLHNISQQQSRFNTITPVLTDFQNAVQRQLGSSVTVMKETNYCQTEEQDDINNGRIWCGKMIEGAINELPGTSTLQPSTVTMTAIDAIAHTAFTTASVSISSSSPNVQGNQSSDFVDYSDMMHLFGQQMVCYVIGSKPYSVSDNLTPPISVGKNQVYFSFRCEQRSSKKFFQYYKNYSERF